MKKIKSILPVIIFLVGIATALISEAKRVQPAIQPAIDGPQLGSCDQNVSINCQPMGGAICTYLSSNVTDANNSCATLRFPSN